MVRRHGDGKGSCSAYDRRDCGSHGCNLQPQVWARGELKPPLFKNQSATGSPSGSPSSTAAWHAHVYNTIELAAQTKQSFERAEAGVS